MKVNVVLLALLMMAGISCNKTEERSPVPEIKFLSLSRNTVKAGSSQDTVHVIFSYKDGDADLGNDPSVDYDIFLINPDDTSHQTDLKYFLPNIPEDLKDPSVGLEGICTVTIPAAFLLLDSLHQNGDTIRYEVYMKDIAGHESNRFITPDIFLLP